MAKLKLSRRKLLRAATSASIAIALPPLEAMFDGNGERLAHAAGGLPRRLVTFFMGNGVATVGPFAGRPDVKDYWIPPTTGANFTLSPSMAPLAAVKDRVRVMSGLKGPFPNTGNHLIHFGHVMSGTEVSAALCETQMGGPTVDFIAAKTLSAGTRFKQLSLLVAGMSYNAVSRNAVTFDDTGKLVRPLRTPVDLFEKLFTGFTPPGATAVVDPALVRRKNILDFVREDASRLRGQVSAADRQRLDEHLTSIEDVQKSIIANSVGALASCVVPGAPAATLDYKTMTRQMSDLIALAFACDQTRVVAFGPTGMTANVVLPWISAVDLHSVSHRATAVAATPGETVPARWLVEMNRYTQWLMEEYAYLVQKLSSITEGAKSVLDNTLVVTGSEHGCSDVHAVTELPHVIAGGPELVTGNFHWRAPGAPLPSTSDSKAPFTSNARLWLSVLRALGVPAASFGPGETGTVPLK